MSIALDTLQRQWQMLRMVPRHPRKISGRELTARLDSAGYVVTKRTVERDLQGLSGFFPLVVDTRSIPYGWSWQRGATALDVPALNPTEALSFLMMRQFLEPLVPGSLLEQMTPYFGMAEQCLAAQGTKSPARRWMERVAIVPPWQPLLPAVISPDVNAAVQEALLLGQQLQIRYQKRGERTAVDYVAHPLGLVQRGGVLYLVASLFDYPDIRLLVLHRMRKAEVLDELATRRADFDLNSYIEAGNLGFGQGKTIELQLRFSREAGAHLWDTPLSANQTIVEMPNGQLEVRAHVVDTLQLRWWLLGFADGVEVLSPPTLRAELASRLEQAAATYRETKSS